MKKIKQFLKHVIHEDTLTELMHVPGSNEKYSEAIKIYRALSEREKK